MKFLDFDADDLTDLDGAEPRDTPEANEDLTQRELDRFRKPVFGPVSHEIHNTHNGNLPGHVRAGEDPAYLKKIKEMQETQEHINLATESEVSGANDEVKDALSNNYYDREYLQTENGRS